LARENVQYQQLEAKITPHTPVMVLAAWMELTIENSFENIQSFKDSENIAIRRLRQISTKCRRSALEGKK
jgi:hypothetical protein